MKLLLVSTSLLISLGLPQDDPPAEEPTIGELVAIVRNTRLDLVDREPAMQALLDRGVEGAGALTRELERQGSNLVREWTKKRKALLKDFARAAPRHVEARLTRTVRAEIEELRARVLGHSRDGGLTKETVRTVCDPAVEELEGWLALNHRELLAADEDLGELEDEALSLATDAWVVADWWDDAAEVLAGDPAGARYLARAERPEDLEGAGEALSHALEELAVRATPMTSGDLKALDSNAELAGKLDPEEFAGVRILNLRRVYLGLPALTLDLKLTAASRSHSRDMVEHGFFAHDSPIAGRETPWKRAAQEGTSAGAENIAAGQSTGEGAIQAWWYSPGHHRNMMGGHARVGLGRHASTWTQLFGS